jgi:hypothetical protein
MKLLGSLGRCLTTDRAPGWSSTGRWCVTLIAAVMLAGGAAAAPVTSVSVESLTNTAQGSVPITFGQVFKAGDVPSGSTVALIAGGQPLPAQVDVRTRHPDGSISHAVISTRVPTLAAGGSVAVGLEPRASGSVGGDIVLADLLASAFDSTVTFNIGGTVYSANARDFLANQKIRTWLSGSVASEWAVGGPVKTAAGASHPQLATYFHVRAYGKPVTAVRVDVVIENAVNMTDGASDIAYNSTINVAGTVRDTRTVTHYPRARWHQVFWWGQTPQVYVRHDVKYLQGTKAFPRYMDLVPTSTYLNSVPQVAVPMGNGDLTADMHAPGAQDMIGPLPRWAAAYIVSADPRAYTAVLAHDSMAGSYSAHFRDEATGQPVSVGDRPQATTPAKGSTVSALGTDDAHLPSLGFASYVLTGDLFYLEETQFWASYVVLEKTPTLREFGRGIVVGANWQIRGQAWSLRALGEAAFISPGDDLLRQKFTTNIVNSLEQFRALYFRSPVPPNDQWANHLHAMDDRGDDPSHYPPWQDDFATWSFSRLVDLGFDAHDVLAYKAKFPVGRMGEPTYDYCYTKATESRNAIGASLEQRWFSTFRQVYEANYGPLPEACPDGMAFEDNYPKSASGYSAGNMRIAVVAAVNSGIPGAIRAWQKFDSAVRVSSPNYDDYPNWALVPDTAVVRPKPPGALVIK